MSEEKQYYTDEEVQADFRRFLCPRPYISWPAHIILRHDTPENWEKFETILKDHEIAVIDYPDGNIKTIIGDGKSKALDCKELIRPFNIVTAKDRYTVTVGGTSDIKNKIPFHSKDSIKIFLDKYSIEFDETNSFPKYLYRGLDECNSTLTGDNLVFELCYKILELSSKGENNETAD